MYLIKRTTTFTNHHTGATRTRVETIQRTKPLIEFGAGYVSDDNFNPTQFGNGYTSISEEFLGGKTDDDSIPVVEASRFAVSHEHAEERRRYEQRRQEMTDDEWRRYWRMKYFENIR